MFPVRRATKEIRVATVKPGRKGNREEMALAATGKPASRVAMGKIRLCPDQPVREVNAASKGRKATVEI